MLSFCRNGSLPLPSTKAQGRTRCRRYDWRTLACYGGCKDANKSGSSLKFVNKILLRAIAGALSVAFVSSFYSPPLAAESIRPAVELCPDEAEVAEEVSSSVVRNEDLVEEAWEIVNESFLGDAGSRSWSQEKWLQYKKYIFQNDIQTRSGAHDVIRKMLATLEDPYTRFLTPAEFSKMARYDVTGIGVNLREVPDQDGATKIKVLGVILEGPAHSAGVRQGDELLSVNGLSVKGKSAFEVSSMLQGPKETFVDIEVRHGDCGPIHSITLQRKNVARTPVFYRLENLGKESVPVGYIQIKEFNALARKDLMIALNKLHKSGATYLVLDLRNNLGGLVQAGIEVAKLFLDQGETVIYTAGRNSEVQNTFIAEAAPFSTNTVIVLVNNRTASASEIVASALRDNCKAVLVGEKTYGKGLIQSVYELHDGSGVVVTIGKYITPSHMDINGNGIEPDFSNFPALNEVRRQLTRCQLLRSGLDLKTVLH